ncbi:nucleotidyltransferase [Herbiconiux sp. CPCC 203407]|uniref:Nucleotidyltransferase n=1 Tax=Herbiconiux oxytropis TaxID=2970915 RepID=A0AA41XAB5_9MICO|nr:nucleotidyltransferase [Herbiconiux oxytropis]MCS5721492.1 nucleotidyltransferase [Herbiconiux oxytropis]MCS5724569.1 nucleotidyltransferase [Herbiconiux oxytropis]
MAHLKQQFKDALSSIEPSDDKTNAPEAHRLVRETLEADTQLTAYGVDPVLIGSYKRSVSIKRVKDVDVFVRLPEVPNDVTSKDILDRFFTVLHAEFGSDDDGHRRTKRQDRSLQVSFPEYDLYVDAVPARPHWDGETWEIPQKGAEDKWVRTNPGKLTSLSSEMNAAHDGYYVPTVKLLRQTRRSILGSGKKPGGFFIEVAAYQAFASGLVMGNDHAEYYVSALEEVSKVLDSYVSYGIGVNDPTLPGHTISIRATDDELDAAKASFADAAKTAREALNNEDEGKAALAFKKLLGKNGDDETVFPMPPGFDEDGSKRASAISAGARTVPAGTRTFG